eukprot:15354330-Alexandrium_andersonii.AAC.1
MVSELASHRCLGCTATRSIASRPKDNQASSGLQPHPNNSPSVHSAPLCALNPMATTRSASG